MLLVVRIPRLPGGVARSRSLGLGWGFLKGRPELVRLLALSTSVSFANSVGAVLISPLVLSFASAGQLGAQFFVGGCGLLAGSVLLGAWGGPRRPVRGTLQFMLLGATCLALHGLRPSLLLVSVAGCGFLFCSSIVKGTTAAALQSRVPAELQGRVSALSRLLGLGTATLA